LGSRCGKADRRARDERALAGAEMTVAPCEGHRLQGFDPVSSLSFADDEHQDDVESRQVVEAEFCTSS